MNVNAYVGLPFVPRGRTRDGVDCYGLFRLVFAERFDIALPSFDGLYTTTEDGQELADIIAQRLGPWREVEVGTERAGDGVLMSFKGLPRHIGLVLGSGRALHIERGAGSLIESYQGPRLRPRVLGFFRHESQA